VDVDCPWRELPEKVAALDELASAIARYVRDDSS